HAGRPGRGAEDREGWVCGAVRAGGEGDRAAEPSPYLRAVRYGRRGRRVVPGDGVPGGQTPAGSDAVAGGAEAGGANRGCIGGSASEPDSASGLEAVEHPDHGGWGEAAGLRAGQIRAERG